MFCIGHICAMHDSCMIALWKTAKISAATRSMCMNSCKDNNSMCPLKVFFMQRLCSSYSPRIIYGHRFIDLMKPLFTERPKTKDFGQF